MTDMEIRVYLEEADVKKDFFDCKENNLKCPFCLQKMSKSEDNMFYCGTDNCSLRYIEMPKKAVEEFAESYQDRLTDCKRIGNLNEELIRTRKTLEQSEICCTEWEKQALDYKAENIALSGELECTRKALEIAVDALKDNLSQANFREMLDASRFHCIRTKCELALEQITALEQKD